MRPTREACEYGEAEVTQFPSLQPGPLQSTRSAVPVCIPVELEPAASTASVRFYK